MDADGNGSGLPKRPLTTSEMAAWVEKRTGLPVHAATIRRACERGTIMAVRVGGRWYVTPEAVRRYLRYNQPHDEAGP